MAHLAPLDLPSRGRVHIEPTAQTFKALHGELNQILKGRQCSSAYADAISSFLRQSLEAFVSPGPRERLSFLPALKILDLLIKARGISSVLLDHIGFPFGSRAVPDLATAEDFRRVLLTGANTFFGTSGASAFLQVLHEQKAGLYETDLEGEDSDWNRLAVEMKAAVSLPSPNVSCSLRRYCSSTLTEMS